MKARNVHLWTIAELSAQVARALAINYQGTPNGRVRDIPDERTIRYYTTLGLLDRPAQMQGRTALYGRKHLLQLVAIKRLQARGLSLVEVQKQLVGLPEKKLGNLAQLPEPHLEAARPTSSRDDAFWSIAPALIPREDSKVEEGNLPAGARPEEARFAPLLPLQGLGLADGVTMLLAAQRPLDEEDISALRTAAAPLLQLLQKRRLVCPRVTKGDNHGPNVADLDR